MNRASKYQPYFIFNYATTKLTTLRIATTQIAGEVDENLPVNIFIKA